MPIAAILKNALKPVRGSIRTIRSLMHGSRRGTWKDQWCRVVMNRETSKWLDALPHTSMDTLEISGDAWDRPGYWRSYRNVFAPHFDICAGALPRQTFDIIIAEQVWEHLLQPYRATRNVFDMLRPNGYFFLTTPFLIEIHPDPVDCTRWTETGMRHFLAEAGFPLTQIQTGSWGNRACINANFGPGWPVYRRFFHSLVNEPQRPVAVWALARKALPGQAD